MENLMDGLLVEISRNEELLEMYDLIPAGAFGAAMIRADVERARKAISDNDTVAMMKVFKSLKESN